MQRRARYLPTLVLLFVLSACASSGSSGSTGSGPNLLTSEDLAEVSSLSAFDAIQRLRPQWLQARAGQDLPRVVMNGSLMGGVDNLRSIQVGDLTSMRFRNGRDATTRYGTGYGGGAIELSTRAP
jgi:hypothetical protein